MHSFILLDDSFSGLEYFPKHTWANQHSAEYWEPSRVFSFLVLCPTNSRHLGFLRLSPVSSILLVCWTPPTESCARTWKKLMRQYSRVIVKLTLFIPQGSLSFTAWCTVYWKLLFYTFFHFPFVSELKVNLVPVISSWLEAECRRYVIPFGPCY